MSSLIYHRLKASGLCFSSCHPSCCSEIQESDQKGPAYTHVGTHPAFLCGWKHRGRDYGGGSRLSLSLSHRICDEDTPGFICRFRALFSWGCSNLRRAKRSDRAAWSLARGQISQQPGCSDVVVVHQRSHPVPLWRGWSPYLVRGRSQTTAASCGHAAGRLYMDTWSISGASSPSPWFLPVLNLCRASRRGVGLADPYESLPTRDIL